MEIAIQWVGGYDGDAVECATFGALTISAGPAAIPLTEVEDTIARTVRPHIYAPASALAEWILVNWWRLRWEGGRRSATPGWAAAHGLSSIGRGIAWPALEFSSDGDFVQMILTGESAPDAAAVRYLRDVVLEVPASEFESAIERFLDAVEGHLATCVPGDRTIADLRAELRSERERPSVARDCRWQALAGIDPAEASDEWLVEARELADEAGTAASDEILAALPSPGGLSSARQGLDAMRNSATTVDLRLVGPVDRTAPATGLPWQRGARVAQDVRRKHGLPVGPVSDKVLAQLLGVNLPLQGESRKGVRAFGGGFRNGVTSGRTAILVPSPRIEAQRFYLARLLGCALTMPETEHVLPVTSEATALQKLERSFAQELLCPWEALDAYTNEAGTDEEGIADAAEHFQVSEWLVLSTLVNRGKLPRRRLPAVSGS